MTDPLRAYKDGMNARAAATHRVVMMSAQLLSFAYTMGEVALFRLRERLP